MQSEDFRVDIWFQIGLQDQIVWEASIMSLELLSDRGQILRRNRTRQQ
jgi:hypothetical protein